MSLLIEKRYNDIDETLRIKKFVAPIFNRFTFLQYDKACSAIDR